MPTDKRVKLTIKKQGSSIRYSIRDPRVSDEHITSIVTEGVRENAIQKYKGLAVGWRTFMSGAAAKLTQKREELWRSTQAEEEREREIERLENEFMKDVGAYVRDISDEILSELMPSEDGDFWNHFNELIDAPSKKAQADEDDDPPLFQIHAQQLLSDIPWWLCRTPDQSSLWCCRYAMAFVPSSGPVDRPGFSENAICILSITRPTRRLKYRLPITDRSFMSAKTLYSDEKLHWRLLDGYYGQLDDPGPELTGNPIRLSDESFIGVCIKDIGKSAAEANVFYYNVSV